jgi:periplasmic protein TonB
VGAVAGVAPPVYFEFQVEIPARPLPDVAPPRYPDMMRATKASGEVLVQFVVDTNGRALPETFKVLKSTHELFTQSVRAALPDMRFTPATLRGVPVRQIMQHPFYFTVTP